MKKQTKSFLLTLLFVLSISILTFVLTGCVKTNIVSYEVEKQETYYINSDFEPGLHKLKLKLSNGQIQEIAITEDMIKQMPDMTVEGEKTIVIIHDNKEYEFKIVVVDNRNEMINKINQFLNAYNANVGNNNVNLTVGYDVNLKTTAFDEQVSTQLSEILFSIKGEDLQYQPEFTQEAYDNLSDVLVNSVAKYLATNQVSDVNKLEAEIEAFQYLTNLANELAKVDYESIVEMRYNEIMSTMPEEVKNEMIEEICRYINNVLLDRNKLAESDVRFFVEEYFYQLLTYESRKNLDIEKLVADFANLLDKYSTQDFEQTPVRLLAKVLKMEDISKDSIVEVLKECVVIVDEDYNAVKNAETEMVETLYVETIIDCFELIFGQTQDLNSSIKDKLNTILSLEDTYLTSKGLKFREDFYSKLFFERILTFVNELEIDVKTAIVNQISDLEVVEYLVNAFEHYYVYNGMDPVLKENIIDAIYQYINLSEVSKENRDYFITEFCKLFDVSDAEIQDYIEFYDENGYAPILADAYLESGYGLPQNVLDAVREFYLAVDRFVIDGFDIVNLVNLYIDTTDTLLDYAVEMNGEHLSSQYIKLEKLRLIAIDLDTPIAAKIQQATALYKQEIKEYVLNFACHYCEISKNSSDYIKLNTFVSKQLSAIENGTITFNSFRDDFVNLVTKLENQKVRTIVAFATIYYCLITDADVDYNELFEGIELPPQIESIDFNKLFAKLKDVNTYKDMYSLKDVTVTYLKDGQGNITHQVMVITLKVNCDFMIATNKGEMSLIVDLNFA